MSAYRYQEPDKTLVPFGKYKDQPVEVMLADPDYIEWIMAQPGLVTMIQQRHLWLFNIITVGAPKTDDTPEHNQMQVRFLERDFQYAFIEAVLHKSVYAISKEAAAASDCATEKALKQAINQAKESVAGQRRNKQFTQEHLKESESDDSKAYWEERLAQDILELTKRETLLAATEREMADLAPVVPIAPKVTVQFECGYDVHLRVYWVNRIRACRIGSNYDHKFELCDDDSIYDYNGEKSRWRPREDNILNIQIELKPQMGDDFPSVLRQMNRNGAGVLVIGSFEATNCTLEQVRGFFGAKRIITLSEIEAIKDRGVWPAS